MKKKHGSGIKKANKLLVSALMIGALVSAPVMADMSQDLSVIGDTANGYLKSFNSPLLGSLGDAKIYTTEKITDPDYTGFYTYRIHRGENEGFYIVSLVPNNMSTSPNITWSTNDTGLSVEVYLGAYRGGDPVFEQNTPYYYSNSHSVISDRINDTLDNIGTSSNRTLFTNLSSTDKGSAIYNTKDKSSVDIFADFVSNSSTLEGGAISNSSTLEGGAIYNSGKIKSINSDFIKNSSDTQGGSIYNEGEIADVTGNYFSNSAQEGGAIYNAAGGQITNIAGDFICNYANNNGGAIYNAGEIGTISGTFIDNKVNPGDSDAAGGAIYNAAGGQIGNITGDFINNYTYFKGSAIYNKGEITNISGNFTSNAGEDAAGGGGIIYNDNGGRIGTITGTFNSNNSAKSVIYNYGTIDRITADFIDNEITETGPFCADSVIINQGQMSIITTDDHPEIKFVRNIDYSGGYNSGFAISNVGTLNLLAKEGQTINFNDGNYIYNDTHNFFIGNATHTGTVNSQSILNEGYFNGFTPEISFSGNININAGVVNVNGDIYQDNIYNNATLNLGGGVITANISGEGTNNVRSHGTLEFQRRPSLDGTPWVQEVSNLHLSDYSGINLANNEFGINEISNNIGTLKINKLYTASHNTFGFDIKNDNGNYIYDKIKILYPEKLPDSVAFDVTSINVEGEVGVTADPLNFFVDGSGNPISKIHINDSVISNNGGNNYHIWNHIVEGTNKGLYIRSLGNSFSLHNAIFAVDAGEGLSLSSWSLNCDDITEGEDTGFLNRYSDDKKTPRVLNIYGNGRTIDGDNHAGIIVDSRRQIAEPDPESQAGEPAPEDPGDSLTLNNLSMKNFKNTEVKEYDYDGNGGAISNAEADTVTIFSNSNVKFDNNRALKGGAIYNKGNLNLLSNNLIEFVGSDENSNTDSVHNEGTININKPGTDYTYDGLVKFNAVTDNDTPKGIMNIHGGKVEVKDDFTQMRVTNNGTLSFIKWVFDEEKGVNIPTYTKTANIDTITGNGTLTMYGGNVNIKTAIAQDTLNINAGTFTANANNMNIATALVNKGTLATYGNLNNLSTLDNTNGTVQIATDKTLNVTGDKNLGGTLDLNGQTLDMREAEGEEVTPVYSTLTVNSLKGTGDLLIDAALGAEPKSDKIVYSAVEDAVINLTDVNVREGFATHTLDTKDDWITVLVNNGTGSNATFKVGGDTGKTTTQFGNYYRYTFEKGTTEGTLKVTEELTVPVSLTDYITANDKGVLIDTYSFAENETLTEAITTGTAKDTYVLGMNGLNLTAGDEDAHSGITVSTGKTLTINGKSGESGNGTISNFATALINGGTLVINNVNFESNSAADNGGAIDNRGDINSITGNFERNSSANNNGGAIYNVSAIINNIVGDFTNNSAINGNGGAIYNEAGIIGTITGNFEGNSANLGGAIYNTETADINIIADSGNITFNGNYVTSEDGHGGAIYNENNGTVGLYAKTTDDSITFTGVKPTGVETAYDIDGIYNLGILNINGDGNAEHKTTGTVNLQNVAGSGITNIYGGTVTSIDDFIQDNLNIFGGALTINADHLKITNDIHNDGTLILNAGALAQAVAGTDATSNGIVDIQAGTGSVTTTSTASITNNIIKLTSGTLDITGLKNSNSIDLSGATKLEGAGGRISAIDNIAENINLGHVDTTSSKIGIGIDVNYEVDESDVLSLASFTGENKIVVDTLNVTANPEEMTPFSTNIADDSAKSHLDLTTTTFSGEGIGNFLISYDNTTGNLTGNHSNLTNAITSTLNTKIYNMANNESINNVTLGGASLSVTANGNTISATTTGDNGITVASGQTLSISGATISDFGTAITNGGTVNLSDVTVSTGSDAALNTISNNGALQLSGTNVLNSTIAGEGTAEITSGLTTNNGKITQNTITVASGATLTTNGNVTTTNGVTNAGTLNLLGGTSTSRVAINSAISGDDGITNFGDGSNAYIQANGLISQTIIIKANADVVASADNIGGAVTNSGTLNLGTGTLAKAITGTGTTNIYGGIVNANNNFAQGTLHNEAEFNFDAEGKTGEVTTLSDNTTEATGTTSIKNGSFTVNGNATQNAISVSSGATLTTNGNVTTSDGIANTGNLNLLGGTSTTSAIINSAVTGDGTTNFGDGADDAYIELNGAINQTITINTNANVTTNAGNIGGAVTNDGTLILNAGALSKAITGGNVTIDGSVVNKATIKTGKLDVNASKNFTNNTEVTAKTIANTGDFVNNGTTVAENSFDNTGNVTNNNSIAAQSINNTGKFTANEGSVVQGNLTGGEFNSNGTNTFVGTLQPNDLTLNNGMLNMLGALSANNTVANGGGLNMLNGGYETANLGNLSLNNDMLLALDSNIATSSIDKIYADSVAGTGKINMILNIPSRIDTILTSPNIKLNPIANEAGEVRSALSHAIKYQGQTITTPIFNYHTNFDQETGLLSVATASGGSGDYSDVNPAVMATPVAAQMGGYINLINSYEDAFMNMDMTMSMTLAERTAMKNRNKYAAADESNLTTFSPNQFPEENAGVWFRPYASFEKVNLNNGPKVGNNSYGGLIGADSKLIELKHGWDVVYTGYAGYNGSHQHYEGNSVWNNGGQLGGTAVFYKNNFFTGLTATTGVSVGEATTMFGREDFTMLMAGVANKTGYNWELFDGKFIIQPSMLMSYSFVNTFDYNNAAGVRIESDPLHSIQLVPGLKFIGNLPRGWQPYIGVQMVWNIMDKTRVTANNVSLPETSIDPYVQYGVGVQKRWGEKLTGFFQTMLRNGGRTGIALSGGFRWALGKDVKNPDFIKTSNSVPELPKTKIELNSTNK